VLSVRGRVAFMTRAIKKEGDDDKLASAGLHGHCSWPQLTTPDVLECIASGGLEPMCAWHGIQGLAPTCIWDMSAQGKVLRDG
jgi:hypothetical protein